MMICPFGGSVVIKMGFAEVVEETTIGELSISKENITKLRMHFEDYVKQCVHIPTYTRKQSND